MTTTDDERETGADPAVDGELRELLHDLLRDSGVPGIAAGLFVDGATYTAGAGVTSVDHPLPVDGETLFQIGSVSKTFTSALALQLVEDGLVDLADPVAQHLPGLGSATGLDTEAMTIEHLLSHQSGFDGDHLLVTKEADDLTALADARRLFDPGTGFSYSNGGFSIAGAVIEAVTGDDFEAVARRRLLRPLGMRSAGFRADRVITNKVAMPHVTLDGQTFLIRGGVWQDGWELGRLDRPVGGLIASVEHLIRWGRFQLDGSADDGTPLLSADSLDRMHTPIVEATPRTGIGLDWFVHDMGGAVVFGHGGETPGYLTELMVAPASGVVVAVTTNAMGGGVLGAQIWRWALERFAGIVHIDPEPVDDARSADRVTGRYLHAFGSMAVETAGRDGRLTVEVTPRDDVQWQPPAPAKVTIAPYGPTDYVSTDAPGPARLYRFGLDDGDEPAAWIQSGFRRAPRVG